MAQKPIKKISQTDSLESHIQVIIEKVIQEREINLAVEDVKVIINEMMPDIDRMISKKVKAHFHAMGLFLMETFKPEE